jgi:HAE1 family hydrophobic/amphiphilic exporter-1
MSISTPFIQRPVATSLFIAALVLVGLAAYPLLPVAPLPRVDFPTINVNVKYPGASPDTMATAVAQPLERQFAIIPGIAQMTSVSVAGSAQITIQFDLDRSIDGAAGDVLAQINAATGALPKNLPSPPTYWKVNPSEAPIMILGVQSESEPMIEVDDYADTVLAQQISQLSGVGQVFIAGEQKRSVRIEADPAKLANMGLTLEDIRAVLTSSTADAPKGTIDGTDRSYTIFNNDQITKAAEFDNVIVGWRAGAPIRVKDIGYAVDSAENHYVGGIQNGKPGVILLIFKQPGANVIDTVERIKARLPSLEASIPPSIKTVVIVDRTLTIRASVADVQFTMILSICLVVMVIFLFLRNFWATVIPSITVPVALICTFAVMYLMDYSLDNLSLMALTIAVGFVVDDAIVMLENIFRHIENGMRPMEAALKGASEIGFTIVSISASLIAVFIPLLLMGGIVGRLFREFAMTVTIAVVVSAIVSLTLTPMMCSRFLHHGNERHGFAYRMVEGFFTGLIAGYRRTLDMALRFHYLTFATWMGTLVLTGYLFVIIPKGFFPPQDTGIIIATTEAAQDISYQHMGDIQRKLTDVIASDPDTLSYASNWGNASAGYTLNTGRVFIALKPWDERVGGGIPQYIARNRAKLAAIEGGKLFMQAIPDVRVGARISKTEYQYTLQDADLDELMSYAPRVEDKLKKLPMLRDVTTDQQVGGTTATIAIDRDQAARFGIQPQVIDDTLYDAFGQRQITQYFTQVNSFHIVLEVMPGQASDLETINKLYVRSSTGQVVPLKSFVKWTSAPVQPLSISHQSMFPAVTISFNLAQGAALGDAVTAINAAMADMHTPLSLSASFQGTAQAFQESLKSQPYLVLAALVTVYIILGILYESYILPITILSTLPSAGVGALLMLLGAGVDLSVIAMIGMILLIGIVKKNGIMMVDFAISAERNRGVTPHEAIREACLLRFRPILMTTMAALLSGLPLMLSSGAGSEFRKPLGYSMVGGLALSQVLTLYTTPVIYLYLSSVQRLLSRRPVRMPTLAAKMGDDEVKMSDAEVAD